MEISLVVFLLIAIGCAVLSAMVVLVCSLCCCYMCRRRGIRKVGQERISYDVSSPCMIKIDRCQPSAVSSCGREQERDEMKSDITQGGDSHYIFDERTVVEKAKNEDKTLVWTSRGQVVQGKPGADHAVEAFVSTDTQPDQITELYIKESPCYSCSTKLIKHFTQCHNKPTLFLGKIKHLHNVSDREGLRQLIQEGFDIKLWTHLHNQMYGDDHTTSSYIKELKNETTMYCYFGIYN